MSLVRGFSPWTPETLSWRPPCALETEAAAQALPIGCQLLSQLHPKLGQQKCLQSQNTPWQAKSLKAEDHELKEIQHRSGFCLFFLSL